MKKTTRQLLHTKLWDLQSERIRKTQRECFTCGARVWNEETGEWEWKHLQAGHYIHNKLDFHPMNINAQCPRCNKWLSGNLGMYAEKLIKKYGRKKVEKLRLEAQKTEKWPLEEYERRIEEEKKLLAKL